ncbi:MAG: CDP-diacylglycerol--glycerol-3-phosphate 3-phosphatidyltransferase [Proteobacteria bacterium]|nr:CDP-diacylglycerol--glycerol-3-phosphate 3-phosphatidyltransferase [Pseudomonadota bacterium]
MKHLPNILTLSRIFVIPVLIASFYLPAPWGNWVAFVVFTLAGITDYFDGLIARTFEVTSKLGQFLDPVADKLMVAATLLMLTAFGTISGIHILAAMVIPLREILVSGLREFLSGMEVSVPVTKIAKWKTAFQMIALGALLIGNAAPPWLPAMEIGLTLLWLSAIFTLYTGYDYLKAGLKHF